MGNSSCKSGKMTFVLIVIALDVDRFQKIALIDRIFQLSFLQALV